MTIESTFVSFSPGPTGTAAFQPGNTLHGTMTLVIGGSEPHKLSSVLVKIRGLAKTLWKTRHGSKGKRRTHTHTEELWMLREDIHFISAPGASLSPGRYEYPFTHTLRQGLPPTFSSQYGNITYMCKARAHSSEFFSFDSKTEHVFVVLPVLDLNADHTLMEPVVVRREAERSLFGHAIGQFTLTMARQGYTAGQRIALTLDGPDRLFEKQLKSDGVVKLKKLTVCTAHNGVRETKQDVSVIKPGSALAWRYFEVVVPNQECMTISKAMCRIINVIYYVKVSSRHINQRVPVVIGTVPLGSGSDLPSARQAWSSPVAGALPTRYDMPRSNMWTEPSHVSPAASGQFVPSAPMVAPVAPVAVPEAPDYDPPPSYSEVMGAESTWSENCRQNGEGAAGGQK